MPHFDVVNCRQAEEKRCSSVESTLSGLKSSFLERFFDGFTGFTGHFLDPPEQLILFAFDVLKIVIRKDGPFLFQAAFENVPGAFGFECVHHSELMVLRVESAPNWVEETFSLRFDTRGKVRRGGAFQMG